MKNDSLDRFGTTLEKRFSQKEIREMMLEAGLKNIKFSKPSFGKKTSSPKISSGGMNKIKGKFENFFKSRLDFERLFKFIENILIEA